MQTHPILPAARITLVAALLTACGQAPEERNPAVTADTNVFAEASAPKGAEAPSSGLPPSNEVLSEEPFTPESAQGAATVVETYYALLEAGKYAEAMRLRWNADELDAAGFAAGFAPYSEYHATVGAPSEIQGAAGSLYVEVPVQLYGRLKDGKPFGQAGTVTLRRVNNVPGSTAEQRRWRIYSN